MTSSVVVCNIWNNPSSWRRKGEYTHMLGYFPSVLPTFLDEKKKNYATPPLDSSLVISIRKYIKLGNTARKKMAAKFFSKWKHFQPRRGCRLDSPIDSNFPPFRFFAQSIIRVKVDCNSFPDWKWMEGMVVFSIRGNAVATLLIIPVNFFQINIEKFEVWALALLFEFRWFSKVVVVSNIYISMRVNSRWDYLVIKSSRFCNLNNFLNVIFQLIFHF